MEVLEAIRTRRSVRKYEKRSVPEEFVRKILEAGRWAPSASNAQPWSFIVLRDEGVRKEVARAATYGRFLAEAPLGIAVVVDPAASTHPVEDGAIATQNMLLAAHALGLGTCWIGSYGSSYEERVKEVLGIPEDKRLLSIISVGYPAESSKSTRRDLGELVFRDRYGKSG
ncbi:MAG: nitroreductase family protein [Candidatus Hodarchaeaceae archaeon]|nr:nitroreductase family protein [Candidatus Hodarchaeaceae archaeon]